MSSFDSCNSLLSLGTAYYNYTQQLMIRWRKIIYCTKHSWYKCMFLWTQREPRACIPLWNLCQQHMHRVTFLLITWTTHVQMEASFAGNKTAMIALLSFWINVSPQVATCTDTGHTRNSFKLPSHLTLPIFANSEAASSLVDEDVESGLLKYMYSSSHWSFGNVGDRQVGARSDKAACVGEGGTHSWTCSGGS